MTTKHVWVGAHGFGPRGGAAAGVPGEVRAPMVLLRKSQLASWRGAPEDSARAAAVREIGVIDVGHGAIGEALVIGDEPVPTTWLPRSDGGLLVRWVQADDEEHALAAVEASGDVTWSATGCAFKARAGDYALFHSALPGAEAAARQLLVTLALATGIYLVTAAAVVNEGATVVVFRLAWRPEDVRRRDPGGRPPPRHPK